MRIIISAAAGANLDTTVRNLAARMSDILGQPVVAENRAGGNSLPATRLVKQAPPDGYTILTMSNTFVISPNFIRDASYDPVKDFVGIGLMNWVPLLMVTRASAPDKTLREFVTRVQQRPNQLSYASAGIGTATHLPAAMFTEQAGLKMINVPYKGNAPAIADVLSGRVDVIFDSISTSAPLVREGKFRALAGTTEKRSPVFPDLPTLAESGFPGYEFAVYTGLIAPAGTPPAVVAKWHAALYKVTSSPELRESFLRTGTELRTAETPGHFSEFLKREVARTRHGHQHRSDHVQPVRRRRALRRAIWAHALFPESQCLKKSTLLHRFQLPTCSPGARPSFASLVSPRTTPR